MPHTKARAKLSQAPVLTMAGLSQPSAVARLGPRRSGVSVPRRKSPTSLNRLVPIWMQAAPRAAASSGSQSRVPVSCQATAVPTRTGDRETDSVFGRQARNQARSRPGVIGRVAVGLNLWPAQAHLLAVGAIDQQMVDDAALYRLDHDFKCLGDLGIARLAVALAAQAADKDEIPVLAHLARFVDQVGEAFELGRLLVDVHDRGHDAALAFFKALLFFRAGVFWQFFAGEDEQHLLRFGLHAGGLKQALKSGDDHGAGLSSIEWGDCGTGGKLAQGQARAPQIIRLATK